MRIPDCLSEGNCDNYASGFPAPSYVIFLFDSLAKRSDLELDLNEDTLGLLRLSDSKQKAATSSQISSQTRSRRISRAAPLPASKRGNLLLPSIQEPSDKDDVTASHSAIKISQYSDAENEPGRATVSVMPAVRLMPTMKTKREVQA